jgi:hypothetical protein
MASFVSSSADERRWTLPSSRRLLAFAVLLPVAVAGTNQLFFDLISTHHALRSWLYPWMALSTAVLSWCAGRYLQPAWLRWIVFAWCLALLDFLTIAACLDRRIDYQFGYVLVSAQISLLVFWAILGPGVWQTRLPVVAGLAVPVIIFSGSFAGNGYAERSWGAIMLLTSPIVGLLCGGLRYLGFLLHQLVAVDAAVAGNRPTYQFGLKHMLIWLTVSGPLLLLVRGLDLDGRYVFPAALLAVSAATVNLIAIWAVLGGGYWPIRIASLVGVPFLIAQGMSYYSAYLKSKAANPWDNYGSVSWTVREMEDLWIAWLWLDAALLGALLLFLRASGYRLMRTPI